MKYKAAFEMVDGSSQEFVSDNLMNLQWKVDQAISTSVEQDGYIQEILIAFVMVQPERIRIDLVIKRKFGTETFKMGYIFNNL